ncbi:MAG: hypothetical protein GXN94_02520 [Aquificae bacterium]|nr:hypothetical protein [Aquificota bacterium]
MKKVFKYLFVLALAYTIGCGVKGSPYPPYTTAPETVKKAEIKQQDKRLVVYWYYQPRYADGRSMDEPFSFEVFTLDGKLIKEIYREGNLYWFYYQFTEDKEYCFRFKVKTPKDESKLSRFFCYIPTLDYPEEKPRLSLSIVEEGILISWNRSDYKTNLYKHRKKIYYPLPFIQLKDTSVYVDKNVKHDQEYCYYITFENENGVEGYPSRIECILFRDIFPPLPPQSPTIVEKNGKYYLIWSDSPSPDVIGYIVVVNGRQITPFPVKDYILPLKGYRKGDPVEIYAVDRAGNRSPPAIVR